MSTELSFTLRDENADDVDAITALTLAAFTGHPYSRQTEPLIVRSLRTAGALRLSLVASLEGELIGHAAFSPVAIDGRTGGWLGLGPLSVAPRWQRRGVGSALVRSGLRRLSERGAAGCVLVGDPAYYGRFGFAPRPGLVLPGVPARHFMALALPGGADALPTGTVAFHAAFAADA